MSGLLVQRIGICRERKPSAWHRANDSLNRLQIEVPADATEVTLGGPWVLAHVTELSAGLHGLATDRPVGVDLYSVKQFDTASAWAATLLRTRVESAGQRFEVIGAAAGSQSLLEPVAKAIPVLTDTTSPPKH